MMGSARGRLAVALDLLTDSLALVGQHGVYCRSERFPGRPKWTSPWCSSSSTTPSSSCRARWRSWTPGLAVGDVAMIETLAATTRSSSRSDGAAWATSTAPATRASAGRWPSRSCATRLPAIRIERQRFLADARAAAAALASEHRACTKSARTGPCRIWCPSSSPGETLKSLVGGRPLNPRRAIDFAVQIADALADAHAVGLVHGDLSLTASSSRRRATRRFLDFGLAAWIAAARGRSDTAGRSSKPTFCRSV